MSNANVPPPSFLSSCRVLLRCPLCYGAFRTHLQFMNHIRTTHLLTSERNTILCSHAYASNILSPENPLGSQLAAPQHTSSQNVIRHSSGYPSATLLRENMLSAQSTTPQRVSPQNVNLRPPLYSSGSLLLSSVQHAAPQNVIQRCPLYGSGNFFTGNMSSPQPAAAQHHATSRGNNNIVILSSNRNNPTRISDRAPPINWQQMASRNRVGGPNSNDSAIDCTRSLANRLNVPVPTNVDELANIADEQNDVDLTLRL